MNRYVIYAKYVLLHKWFVFLECLKYGLIRQGIIHDLSKFTPRQFFPYARFFYNPDGSPKDIGRQSDGYYKPDDTGDPVFDMAWFWHQKYSKHHWQFWAQPLSDADGKFVCREIPICYLKEMLADWRGAGRAQGRPDTVGWYMHNRQRLHLAPKSRLWIEKQLGVEI